MLSGIQDAYLRTVQAAGIPFDAVTEPGDWHLRVLVLPANQPEIIYDLHFRAGRALFFDTRFQSSVWSAMIRAQQAKGKIQPIPSERRCCELPTAHPLVRLIENEAVFRLCSQECRHLDADHHLVMQYIPGKVIQHEIWEAQHDAGWCRLSGLGDA